VPWLLGHYAIPGKQNYTRSIWLRNRTKRSSVQSM